eukprot:3874-Heterococcus_DN1.PRE.2
MLFLVLRLLLCSAYAILNSVVAQPRTTALLRGSKHDLQIKHVNMLDLVKEEATDQASMQLPWERDKRLHLLFSICMCQQFTQPRSTAWLGQEYLISNQCATGAEKSAMPHVLAHVQLRCTTIVIDQGLEISRRCCKC